MEKKYLFINLFFIFYLLLPKNNTLTFFDIGQGDSSMIKIQDKIILIDTGPDESILYQLGTELNFFEKKIDLVIITHPHSDHYRGLFYLLEKYKIDKILLPNTTSNSKEYLKLIKNIEESNSKIEFASSKSFYIDDNFYLDIITTRNNKFEEKNPNNYSTISRLRQGKSNFIALFTGDTEVEKWEKIKEENISISANILKVSHHGANNGTNKFLVNRVNPQKSIISVGKDNKYNHPHLSTLDLLKNTEIIRTDINKKIQINLNNFTKNET